MFNRLFQRSEASIPSISPDAAWEKCSTSKSDTVLVDVRETGEFARGHAKGARNIPLSQLPQRLSDFPQNTEILLTCQSDQRSMRAATLLQQQGMTRVMSITGGTTVWKMHQLPME